MTPRTLFAMFLAGSLLAPIVASAGPTVREVQVRFEKGQTSATLKGKLKGDETVDYKVRAAAGQSMVVTFKPGNPSAYFNVMQSGAAEAFFVGSTSGNRFEGPMPVDGDYTIRVYLMRSAARRNESTSYTLEVGVSGAGK
jgi:hypothetical protein